MLHRLFCSSFARHGALALAALVLFGALAPRLWLACARCEASELAVGMPRGVVRERLGPPATKAPWFDEDGRRGEVWWYFWPETFVRSALRRSPFKGDHPALALDSSGDPPLCTVWFGADGRIRTLQVH